MELIYVDTVTKMILSESQQIGMDLFKSGKNIFISGPAGTGKSHFGCRIPRIGDTRQYEGFFAASGARESGSDFVGSERSSAFGREYA